MTVNVLAFTLALLAGFAAARVCSPSEDPALQPDHSKGAIAASRSAGNTAEPEPLLKPTDLGFIDERGVFVPQRIGELEAWASRDFHAALAWVDQLPPFPGDFYAHALKAILAGGVEAHTDAVFEVIAERTADDAVPVLIADHAAAFVTIFCLDWARENPEEAVQRFSAVPLTGSTVQTLCAVYGSWAERDPAAAMENFFGRTGGSLGARQAMAKSIARAIAKTDPDPAAALEFLAATDDRYIMAAAGEDVIGYVAGRDPVAALEWVQHNLRSQYRSNALRNVLIGVSLKDPAEAAAMVTLLPPYQQHDVAPNVVRNWARSDPAAALAFTRSLGEGVPVNMVQRSLFQGWLMGDRASMERYLADPETPAAEADIGIQALASDQWESASRWASAGAPDGHGHTIIPWIESLPAERGAEAASSVARQIAERHGTERATLWAGELNEPALRSAALAAAALSDR